MLSCYILYVELYTCIPGPCFKRRIGRVVGRPETGTTAYPLRLPLLLFQVRARGGKTSPAGFAPQNRMLPS